MKQLNYKAPLIIAGLLILAYPLSIGLHYLGVYDLRFQKIIIALEQLGRLAVLLFMVQNGSLIKSKVLLTATISFIIVIVIGALFKIQHWSNGNELFSLGFIGLTATYLFHFFKKPVKELFDYLKLAWIIFYSATAILTIDHFQYSWEMRQFEVVFFLVMYFDFVYLQLRSDQQPE